MLKNVQISLLKNVQISLLKKRCPWKSNKEHADTEFSDFNKMLRHDANLQHDASQLSKDMIKHKVTKTLNPAALSRKRRQEMLNKMPLWYQKETTKSSKITDHVNAMWCEQDSGTKKAAREFLQMMQSRVQTPASSLHLASEKLAAEFKSQSSHSNRVITRLQTSPREIANEIVDKICNDVKTAKTLRTIMDKMQENIGHFDDQFERRRQTPHQVTSEFMESTKVTSKYMESTEMTSPDHEKREDVMNLSVPMDDTLECYRNEVFRLKGLGSMERRIQSTIYGDHKKEEKIGSLIDHVENSKIKRKFSKTQSEYQLESPMLELRSLNALKLRYTSIPNLHDAERCSH